MDVSMLTDLVSNLGFPIVVCVAMFWYINKTEERHKEEVDTLRQALDANTQAVTQLVEHLNK